MNQRNIPASPQEFSKLTPQETHRDGWQVADACTHIKTKEHTDTVISIHMGLEPNNLRG